MTSSKKKKPVPIPQQKFSKKWHVSFSGLLRAYVKQSAELRELYTHRGPAFLLDSKLIAHDFARRLGLNVARIRSVNKKARELGFLPNTFVKPINEACARGVFWVDAAGKVTHMNGYESFTDKSSAIEFATQLFTNKIITKDAWMEEDLISGPNPDSIARDLKFYMFYGKVGLILETQRVPDIRRCWYNGKGEIISVGKYDDLSFEGEGQLNEPRKLAIELSLSIPAPFVRIDFLLKGEEIFFGEITPAPSGYHELDDATDARLGLEFIAASTRLTYDLSLGKKFVEFNETTKSRLELVEKINAGTYYTAE